MAVIAHFAENREFVFLLIDKWQRWPRPGQTSSGRLEPVQNLCTVFKKADLGGLLRCKASP
ncbi:hypothetical protein EBQ24_00570 [Allofranklinella schreckenbergeri]|uniref:Uncharacterized protein n=1 Tax=Allofranklinella schreckenbergeri TaxID=1076744 RepID=A0A3M6R8V0_9BURK|nr:hypothetical protein EBQ24_00570 [Allofranklinella schreckenbergeri]